MPKFRVAYSASKSEHTYRERNGVQELIDSQIVFNKQDSPTVEAKNEEEAIRKVKATLPEGCDISIHAHKL